MSICFFFIFSNSYSVLIFHFSLNSNFSLCSSNLLLISLDIFTIITLDSLLGRLPSCPLVSCCSGVLSCSFSLNTFLCYLIFIAMFVVGWLNFLTVEKWPSVGDILCVPTTYSLLVTRATCSRGVPYVDWVVPLLLWWSDYYGWLALDWLLSMLCLGWRLLASDWQGWVMRCLAVEPREGMG